MKKPSLQATIKEHVDELEVSLAYLKVERADAHDLKLHLLPGLVGRIMEVEKEIEYLKGVLYD
jgi:hypothetical protein